MDDWIGFALIVIGALLLIGEVLIPGFFVAVPGSILIVVGLLVLLAPDLLATVPGIILLAIITIVVTLVTLWFYRSLAPGHKPLSTSMDTLVGKKGEVITEVEPDSISGKVRIDEQIWSARSSEKIPVGEKVIVTRAQGVHVFVCKYSGKEADECST